MAKIFGRNIYFSVIIGAAGLVGGVIFTLTYGSATATPPNQLTMPPSTPYDNTVSGTGIVEANSRNVEIGVFVSGILSELKVNEGDKVNVDDVLMVIDKRSAEADVRMREKDVVSAQTTLADEKDKLKRAMALKTGVAVSESFQKRQQFATARAEANLESAKAALETAKVTLDKHTIHAPLTGEILKVRTRAGEFVNTGTSQAPIVIGNTEPLHLRVQIDENDLWRFNEKANATAFLRSNKDRKYNLSFVRTEPYVQAKKQLSGDNAEQVDTRIMEVVYAIEPLENAPLYVGQQLDVFIEGTN